MSDWLGPYPQGQTIEASHSWEELGDYEIKVWAKDIWGTKSEWSNPSTISIVLDQRPNAPVISGSKIVIGGREYQFSFTSDDPEGHDVYYRVDWDDGDRTEWLGPYNSGETMILGHTWNQKGTYTIKAWALDALGEESSQGSFKINVPISKVKNAQFANILARILATRPILGRILNLI